MNWFVSVLIVLSNIFVLIFGSIVPWPSNSIHEYCVNISIKMDPIQRVIIKRTLENLQSGMMIAAPEVLQLGQNLIQLIQAKKAIDIGTFTGSSAVAWALAMSNDSEVLTIDIYPESYDQISHAMLASGEAGKWDFIFIDADKINYPRYYEQSVKLLRPGGVIIIDNALWNGSVANRHRYERDRNTAAIDETNQKASKDPRVNNYLMNIADGTHMIFKKNLN
ncbi:O-methyltransferase [Onchocerca flexuosa]|uniref:O-methyltransferase n=1 Tax=Onchocerca flexuosa TaxID=387005 RepID=A0A238BJB6_9BILA|nr:O-methyltransferase [Onchocerca flexuosa]